VLATVDFEVGAVLGAVVGAEGLHACMISPPLVNAAIRRNSRRVNDLALIFSPSGPLLKKLDSNEWFS
jgi:hypothetical protein